MTREGLGSAHTRIMDLGDRKELSPSANLTLISVLGQWDPSFFRGCGKFIQLHLSKPALEQVSANRYVTMVIHQKLLPRTKKRGVFYPSLKISLLKRLASYDGDSPAHTHTHTSTHTRTHTQTHQQTHTPTPKHTHTHKHTHTPHTHTHRQYS